MFFIGVFITALLLAIIVLSILFANLYKPDDQMNPKYIITIPSVGYRLNF